MLQDIRFAIRMIATHRWFSLAVVVTLAVGIGINSTVFTLTNTMVFKPVPIPGGERLVTVMNQNQVRPTDFSAVSLPDFREYRTQNKSFEGLEALSSGQAIISEQNNSPERFRMARVTAGLFPLLKTSPILGRGFSTENEKPGAELTVLLGHDVWKNRYGSAPDVIGRVVRINGTPATIIGVMPDGFKFPQNEDLWLPLIPTNEHERRADASLQLFGLLKPSVSIAEARADLAIIGRRLAKEFPDSNKDVGPSVRTILDTFISGPVRGVFYTMLGAVGFVLLIACANVANMMLGRAIARAREISVRAAIGATRWQLVRQLLVESVLLSSLGGLFGLGLAAFGVHLFDLATRDIGKPYWMVFEMDWRAFAYFAAISICSGIVFGLVPALRASRVDLNTALKDGTPSGGSQRGGKLTGALVVLQFALTLVLLAGAGIMMRSFFAIQALNPFVPTERIFTARIELPAGPAERYNDVKVRTQFWENLLQEMSALPGVSHAAVTSNQPGLGAPRRGIEIAGQTIANPEQPPEGACVTQSPGYLPAIGLPIILGRGFSEADGEKGKEAVVITREFAAKYWPHESAVGKRFRFHDKQNSNPWMTVIGVSADIVQNLQDGDEVPPPLFYISHTQENDSGLMVLLRTSADPATLAGPMRVLLRKLDPDLPLFEPRSLTAALDRKWWFLSVFGTLFAAFAATALLMASVGIYAVIAQSTVRRTREIGIRMALGSTLGGIVRLVLSRGMVQLGTGLGVGLVGGFGATWVLQKVGFLFQVSSNDPLVFASTTVLLTSIGLFACWVPARRAARLDPTKALRTE